MPTSRNRTQERAASGQFAAHAPESVIREIQRVAAEIGHTPDSRTFNEKSKMDYSTVTRKFGSWRAGVKLAGLDFEGGGGSHGGHVPQRGPTRKLAEEELLRDLNTFADKIGHTPTYKEMDSSGPHAAKTYSRRFESWNDAVERAGLERNRTEREDGRGSAWQNAAQKARSRDSERCQFCGMSNQAHKAIVGVSLHVHHVEKLSEYEDYSEAHQLANLLTLCSTCHLRFEHTA